MPTEMNNQADHDLLIEISVGQKELKSDVRAMSDSLREMKAALDTTNQRQTDLEARMTNLSGTVQRALADQHDDHKDLGALKVDVSTWKLYLKVALALFSPVYIMILFAAEQALKTWLFP